MKKSRTLEVLSRIINIRAWSDWNRTKSTTLGLMTGIRKFFTPQSSESRESFDEACARLNLSETSLQDKQRGLIRLSRLMCMMAVALVVYGVYQLVSGTFIAFGLSLIVALIACVLAFRYHFWAFQIRKRKLGCSLQEWFYQGLMGH